MDQPTNPTDTNINPPQPPMVEPPDTSGALPSYDTPKTDDTLVIRPESPQKSSFPQIPPNLKKALPIGALVLLIVAAGAGAIIIRQKQAAKRAVPAEGCETTNTIVTFSSRTDICKPEEHPGHPYWCTDSNPENPVCFANPNVCIKDPNGTWQEKCEAKTWSCCQHVTPCPDCCNYTETDATAIKNYCNNTGVTCPPGGYPSSLSCTSGEPCPSWRNCGPSCTPPTCGTCTCAPTPAPTGIPCGSDCDLVTAPNCASGLVCHPFWMSSGTCSKDCGGGVYDGTPPCDCLSPTPTKTCEQVAPSGYVSTCSYDTNTSPTCSDNGYCTYDISVVENDECKYNYGGMKCRYYHLASCGPDKATCQAHCSSAGCSFRPSATPTLPAGITPTPTKTCEQVAPSGYVSACSYDTNTSPTCSDNGYCTYDISVVENDECKYNYGGMKCRYYHLASCGPDKATCQAHCSSAGCSFRPSATPTLPAGITPTPTPPGGFRLACCCSNRECTQSCSPEQPSTMEEAEKAARGTFCEQVKGKYTCDPEKCEATPTPRPPTATPTTPSGTYCYCAQAKVYDQNWASVQTSNVQPGRTYRFAVLGQSNIGGLGKARFKINGGANTSWCTGGRSVVSNWCETTVKKPNSNEYYVEFTIPAAGGTFTVEAEVFCPSGWK